MADVLLELGAQPRLAAPPSTAPDLLGDLFNFVNSWENPAAGVFTKDEFDRLDPAQQKAIAYLRALSKKKAAMISNGSTLEGIRSIDASLTKLRLQISLSIGSTDLGKSKFKKIAKKVKDNLKKVAKVVAAVAAPIPALMKGMADKKKKDEKRAEEAAAAEEQKAVQDQLAEAQKLEAEAIEMYAKSKSLTQDIIDRINMAFAIRQQVTAAQGGDVANLKPPPDIQKIIDEDAAQKAGFAVAVAETISPEAKASAEQQLKTLSPAVQQSASNYVAEYQKQVQAAGSQNVAAAATKAVGQAVAIDQMAQGAGVDGGMLGLADGASAADENLLAAIQQGYDDLLNAAALTGELAVTEKAIARGAPAEFPWTPVAIGGIVVLVSALAYLLVSRK